MHMSSIIEDIFPMILFMETHWFPFLVEFYIPPKYFQLKLKFLLPQGRNFCNFMPYKNL